MSNRGTSQVHIMSENRITNQSHENNGQGNGVLHQALPGTGSLPPELLGSAGKAEGERTLNGAAEDAGSVGGERNKFRSTAEQATTEQATAEQTIDLAGDRTPRSDGRDEQGRFFYGNKGGPGNPYARKVALIKQEILTYCTPEDRRDIMLAMIERANRPRATCERVGLCLSRARRSLNSGVMS
jgi:hypothetical protein